MTEQTPDAQSRGPWQPPSDTAEYPIPPASRQAAPDLDGEYAAAHAYPAAQPYAPGPDAAQPYPTAQPYPPAQPYSPEQPYPAGQYPTDQNPTGQNPANQYPTSEQPAVPGYAAPYAPRPEDLLVPDRADGNEPAGRGWRGRLNRGTGGLLKLKAGTDERDVREAITAIQHAFSRPMTVVVIQPKGGAGKTPTTVCLSAAFGAYRGGYVVGWDDNETRGTLAVRVANPDGHRATVWDLLGDLAEFEGAHARVGDLGHYVRAQPDAHFDALVSDQNPANMAQIGEDEFHRLHGVLQRFYRMIVIDTGNNVRSPNWQAAVNAADLVVVASTYQRDAGYSGSWVLDHLAQTGRAELATNAITVLTAADPTTDKDVREQLLAHFGARTRAVVEIPYDAELAHGGPIRWPHLATATRDAWIRAGATVVSALAERDRGARRD